MISPGIDVLKTWQGIVEISLRVACMVLGVIVLICAAIALNSVTELDDQANRAGSNYEDAGLYESGAGWLIFLAVMCMVIEPPIIVARFLNITIVNENFLIFAIIDIVVSAVFALCFFAGGVANAVYASDNADNYNNIRSLCERDDLSRQSEDLCDNLLTLRNSEGAAAAFSFFTMIAFGALGGIMILNILLKRQGSSGDVKE